MKSSAASPGKNFLGSMSMRMVGLLTLFPALVALILVSYFEYRVHREAAQNESMQMVRALSHAVDKEFANSVVSLQALSMTSELREKDFAGVYALLKNFDEKSDFADYLVLTDASGQQIVNSHVPFGLPLPKTNNLARIHHAVETAQPAVSNLLIGTSSGRPVVVIDVPVVVNHAVRYVLSSVVSTQSLQKLLTSQQFPAYWIAAIADPSGVIAARNLNPGQYVGATLAQGVLEKLVHGHEGAFDVVTLEGDTALGAFRKSELTGYSVAIAVPMHVVHERIWQAMAASVSAIALMGISSLLLAWWFGRQILRSIRGVTTAAQAAQVGNLDVRIPETGPDEVSQMAQQFNRMLEARSEAEQSLRDSETRLRMMTSHVKDYAIIMLDAKGCVASWNDGARMLKGYTESEIIGQSMRRFYLPDAVASGMPDQLLQWAAVTGRAEDEGLRLRKDGTTFYANVILTAIHGRNGQVLGFAKITRDITERKQIEYEQQRLVRALRLLGDSNLAIVHAVNEAELLENICRKVVEAGGYLMGWIGFAEQDAQKSGRPMAQSGYEDGYLDGLQISWDAGQATGQGPTGTALRTGATQVNQNMLDNPNMAPWRDAAVKRAYRASIALPLRFQQRVLGVLTLYSAEANAFNPQEIELLEELASNLAFAIQSFRTQMQRDVAEAAKQAKTEFLANMSHEIRTPLNAVLGLARIGANDSTDLASKRQFDRIAGAGSHLLGVINDILDYSKIESGKFLIDPAPFQVASVVHNANNFVQQAAQDKGLQYAADVSQLPLWVLGDAQHLQQVLTNLLSNAVKFTDQGGVRLSVTCDAALCHFEITDSGIGMQPEQLERLFTPFEQADSSTTRNYGGTGLGLAISQRLAQLMGGQITVRSEFGRGSVFTLSLPLPAATPPVLTEQVELELVQSLAGYRLLAAEDVEVNRIVLEALLVDAGAQVRFVENGAEAVGAVAIDPSAFDAVLMDIQMPVMDGYTATREIHGLAPGLPVIGLTAYAHAEERERCLASGMLDHVTKPIDPLRLIAVLKRCAPRGGAVVPLPLPVLPVRVAQAPMACAFAGQWVDWPGLCQQFSARPGLVEQLLSRTLVSQANKPALLRQAAANAQVRELAQLAHVLRGVAGNLHAPLVMQQAEWLEHAAQSAAPNLTVLAEQMATLVQALLTELRAYLDHREAAAVTPGDGAGSGPEVVGQL